jgi:hypothetical protein
MRHDLQLLADAGIIRTPITTWPISWPDVARDVNAETLSSGWPDDVEQALNRVRRAARDAAAMGFSGIGIAASAAAEPLQLRSFSDTPREEGQVAAGASWLGERWAAAVKLTAALNPQDDREFRIDGSYVGFSVANFMISAGVVERWWGPGWDGSLILSNNARPMPGITIERNYSDASKWPVFKWFGPWRASIAVSQAEGSDVAVPDTRFLAARAAFKPKPWLEVGLSRTAQWCGDGRPCGWGTLKDLLLGNDNRNASLTESDEPGNQMAGYDMRIRSPWKKLPLVGYAQLIGEDEAGGLPSKFLGLFGGETWFSSAWGSVRIRAEFADTTCTFSRNDPQFDCGYRNGLYPQGYKYRTRTIGHSLDNDSRMYSAAGLLVRPNGDTWSVLARKVDFNRGGPVDLLHQFSPVPVELKGIEIQYNRAFKIGAIDRGQIQVGVAFEDAEGPVRNDADLRGYVLWRQGL